MKLYDILYLKIITQILHRPKNGTCKNLLDVINILMQCFFSVLAGLY